MVSQANMVPSILWLSVIVSVSGNTLNKQTRPLKANNEAVANCENNINIGGANEDLVYAGATSHGKGCQAACQENARCDFFVWSGPNGWRPNGCWLKQFKGQSFDSISRTELNGAWSGTRNCGEEQQGTATAAEDTTTGGSTETGKYALGQAGNLKNCPGGFKQIVELNDCKLSALEAGKTFAKAWCYRNPDTGKVCFDNGYSIFFSTCNTLGGTRNPNHRAFCRDENALAPGACKTAADCSADLPTCHAEGFCHDPSKCKFVPAKQNECPGYEKDLPKCHAEMSNGDFCAAEEQKPLPDGNEEWDVNSCHDIFDIYKCVRGEFEVTEGACRTKNGEDDDSFPCDARIGSLRDCKKKCNGMAGCGAVSWDGGICCGLSEKTTTTTETAWKCYDKPY